MKLHTSLFRKTRWRFESRLTALIILCALGGNLTSARAQETAPDISGPTLRELGNALGLYIGYQGNWGVYNKTGPTRILSTEANIAVNSDYMPSGTWTGPNSFDWTFADRTMNRTREFGTREIAYLLPMPNFTGGYYQSWFSEPKTPWTSQQYETMLDAYIQAAVEHNRSYNDASVDLWVVVNEALHQGQGGYQFPGNSQWRQMGWDEQYQMPVFLKKAFESANRARAGNPYKKLLILDEGNAAGGEIHTEPFYRMVASLKAQKTPLDGVGFQMHMKYDAKDKLLRNDKGERLDFEEFGPALQRLADLGLELYIAELDIEMPDGSPEMMRVQANLYRQIVRRALQQPKFKSLILWGTNDQNNWKQGGHAHIFDENDNRKPAYYAIREELEHALAARRAGAPIMNPAPGRYYTPADVRLTTPVRGANIRFTTDGTLPTATHGELYKTPISLKTNTGLRAITIYGGKVRGEIVFGTYSIANTTAMPVTRVQSGAPGSIYAARSWVNLATATPGATIRYTTDGSLPTPTHGAIYDGTAVVVDADKDAVPLKILAYRTIQGKVVSSNVATRVFAMDASTG